VSWAGALEESFFLGLRLNSGVDLASIEQSFGRAAWENVQAAFSELIALGLLERAYDRVRLTARGRLLSNEVFEKFITSSDAVKV
jgi:oxygen-independent coproporphyrinogen-3 oxidase